MDKAKEKILKSMTPAEKLLYAEIRTINKRLDRFTQAVLNSPKTDDLAGLESEIEGKKN